MLYLLSLAVYGAVVLWFSFGLGFRYGVRELVTSPLVFGLMHTGLGAGFWAEAFKSLWTKPAAILKSSSLRRTGEGAVRRSSGGEE